MHRWTCLFPVLFPFLFLSITACRSAPPKNPPVSAPSPALEAAVAEAAENLHLGSFLGYQKAVELYRRIVQIPDLRSTAGKEYLQALLLLALRSKELGILRDDLISEAGEFLTGNPLFAPFSRYVEVVDRIPLHTVGILNSQEREKRRTPDYYEWMALNVRFLNYHLRQRSEESDFFAYLYLAFHQVFGDSFWDRENLARLYNHFPDSRILAYQNAVYPRLERSRLEELLNRDPQFFEAEFHLGEIELEAGRVLSAEKRLLNALPALSTSPALLMMLTRVYFATEEMETCLDYIEKALSLVPDYRAALLGKAQCLWFLGRYGESITVLDMMLDLGDEYRGEVLYWKSRNRYELKLLEEARRDGEQAEILLGGHYEVPALLGLIAYHQGRLKDAEALLLSALDLYPFERESAFYLGKVYTDWKNWESAARFYEKAAQLGESEEAALRDHLAEIESSSLSSARKQRLLHKNKLKLLEVRRIKAVSQYNAAAGYYNLGNWESARELAQKAAQHPVVRSQALQFLERLVRKTPDSIPFGR